MTTSVTSSSRTPAPLRTAAHRTGLACCISAAILVVGCAVTQWQAATTTVPDDAWRFPWSPTAFIATTVLWALTQAALVPALLAFGRSGAAGRGAAGRWGLRFAVAGTVIGVVAHVSSLPFVDAAFDDVVAVAAMFGIGALLATGGFLLAGVGTARAGRWTGRYRWTPLGIGVAGVALMFLQFTPFLPAAVGLYYLGFIPFGLAVARTDHR